jgi:hypothetical protein
MSKMAVERVQQAYVRGEIDQAEMERRIACLFGLEQPEPEPCSACATPALKVYVLGCAGCARRLEGES